MKITQWNFSSIFNSIADKRRWWFEHHNFILLHWQICEYLIDEIQLNWKESYTARESELILILNESKSDFPSNRRKKTFKASRELSDVLDQKLHHKGAGICWCWASIPTQSYQIPSISVCFLSAREIIFHHWTLTSCIGAIKQIFSLT